MLKVEGGILKKNVVLHSASAEYQIERPTHIGLNSELYLAKQNVNGKTTTVVLKVVTGLSNELSVLQALKTVPHGNVAQLQAAPFLYKNYTVMVFEQLIPMF